MSRQLLVAGVGNIFKSDDGVATAVLAHLTGQRIDWPEWVTLRDYGISSLHLAYDLLGGDTDLILVDAMHRDGPPGTVYVVEPGPARPAERPHPEPAVDGHDLAPEAVLSLVPALGGRLGHVTIVGCEPVSTADGIGLSPVVAAQVPTAARAVSDVVEAACARRYQAAEPSHRGTGDG
ncbi:MAG: hydrogenase maturation protease [Intrasporangium sp.]|uniref:hydrogenase maturation protease n=1 Tax=Intrasporangium sp. TaxID=1925024 RepID=UPI003F80F7F8